MPPWQSLVVLLDMLTVPAGLRGVVRVCLKVLFYASYTGVP